MTMELARYQSSLANRQNECKEVSTISSVAFLKHKSESSHGFVSSWLPAFIVIFPSISTLLFLCCFWWHSGCRDFWTWLLGRVFVEKPHFPLMFWTISSNFKRVVPSGTKTCSIFLFKGCSAVSLGLSYEIPLPSWVKKSLCRIETH